MKRSLSLVGSVLAGTVLFAAGTTHAHIKMDGALRSRTPDGLLPGYDDAQKMSPCDGARSAGPVYTFQPGTTVTIAITEVVPHPSYFRIAFDNDGEDGFKEPASIKPIEGTGRACPFDNDDQCGKSDFCNVNDPNGARVLWDNLDPHASGGSTYTWKVTLPNVECENCTLQVIQVMEDTIHGAYCPQGSCANSGNSLEDIYHRCINIKLKQGATNSPGVATGAVSNMGMECPKTAMPDAGVGPVDAGVSADAGAASDAGAPRVDAGAVGSPGGTSGTLAGTGGTLAGSAGGGTSGTQGGTLPSGTTAGGATTGGGTPGGATTGGTTGGLGTTTGTVGNGPNDDDGGCAIALGGGGSSAAGWLGAGVFALILARRLRRRA